MKIQVKREVSFCYIKKVLEKVRGNNERERLKESREAVAMETYVCHIEFDIVPFTKSKPSYSLIDTKTGVDFSNYFPYIRTGRGEEGFVCKLY